MNTNRVESVFVFYESNEAIQPFIEKAMWKKLNKDKTPKTCKFCHAEVWWHVIERRWYDAGGQTLHVENCELRRAHYFSALLPSLRAKVRHKIADLRYVCGRAHRRAKRAEERRSRPQ